MGLCCGFVVLAVGVALALGLGWGGRMGLGWGVCGVLGLGYGVADLGFGFGLWGCRCCGGGSGWSVGGWSPLAALSMVNLALAYFHRIFNSLVSGPTPALLKYLRSGLSEVCWFLLSMLQFDGL
uniref:Uncharacterized protein n=1 Tax=Fagus sylvatica TaxID=28930 RepID=A0A2N9H1A6_FAGSY